MSNDLWEIKQRILSENKVEDLLHEMACEHIRFASNRYEAQLPPSFNSDNRRSVQVYLTEHLQSRIRSKGVSDIDIYGLVSYIIFDCTTKTEQDKNLFKSKKWICDKLGYTIQSKSTEPVKDDPLKWLKDLKKQRERKAREFADNLVLPDSVLNQYIMYPYYPYIKQGLEYRTQFDFQVGFDIKSERVIYPIHNQFGDIISVKGRTIDPDYREKGIYKFLYLYNYNKIIELYNWHNALCHILEKKEIIIFEGEKSCWWATQFGFCNCVAIGGDDISEFQVKMIKQLGVEVKIILAFDKDKSVDDVRKQGLKFGHSRLVYALWDAQNLLSMEKKDSPTDRGVETFLKLYKDVYQYRIA